MDILRYVFPLSFLSALVLTVFLTILGMTKSERFKVAVLIYWPVSLVAVLLVAFLLDRLL